MVSPVSRTAASLPVPEGAGPDEVASKSARTRQAIIDAALRVFREKGFDDATMRAIAAEAGVSVGNAYYYFASKEHLIQGFYDHAQEEHARAAVPVLCSTTDLEGRIVGVLGAWIDVMEPYRAFGGKFFKNAAEPTSPLSPFSTESGPARSAAIALWAEVVTGSDVKIAKYLRDELPELLWLYAMGTVLFWVHDSTDGAARTRILVKRTAPIVVRAIGLARIPGLRATVMDLVALIAEIKTL